MPKTAAIPAGFLLLLSTAQAALAAAEPAAPPADPAGEAKSSPVAVVVELEGYELDPMLIQLAVAKELAVPVIEVPTATSTTVRVAATKGGDLSVVVEQPGKPRLMRAVAAPGRDDEVPEAAALLAGNLARDEATELLSELEPKPQPAVAEASAPERAPEAAKAPAASPPPAPAALPSYPVNLTLFHPVSIVPHVERARVQVELGLFFSRVGQVDAMSANPFVTVVHGRAQGGQFTGVAGIYQGGVRGAALSGVFEMHQGPFQGLAAAGVVSVGRGPGKGLTVAGISATQAGPFLGLEASGVTNVQTDSLTGMQAAGVANVAGDVDGAQISLANVAGDFRGAQIGIVNVASRVEGLQLGLVNVADDIDGASVGFVTYSKSGRVQPVAWYSNSSPVNLGLRLYTGPLYAMPTLGFDQSTDASGKRGDVFSPGLSLGGRIPVARAFVDIDVNYSNPSPEFRYDEHNVDLRYRALVGFEVEPWLAPFLGGGVRHHFRTLGASSESFHPEFCAGVQFF
jgi:hypothetical protein